MKRFAVVIALLTVGLVHVLSISIVAVQTEEWCRDGVLEEGQIALWALGHHPAHTLLNLELTGLPATDFDLYLYRIIDGPQQMLVLVAISDGPTAQESISYRVEKDGNFLVAIKAYEGSGAYRFCVNT